MYEHLRDAARQGCIDALQALMQMDVAEKERIKRMDESLRHAAKQGSIDALYALIQEDANVLDRIDKISFAETPLHIAAFEGHIWFTTEIVKLKPSFARKLNQDGFSPMHLALQKLHELENNPDLQRNQAQLVDRLLDVDSDIVRVPGREGVTPFHYVAQMGHLDLLTKFSEGCPKAYEDVTIRSENVLHVALKYDKVEAFQLLLRWIRQACFKDASSWERKLLLWKDEEHNTLLHVAVSKNQHEASPFHSIFLELV
jgi:ankyrin repeat protein